MMSQPAEIRFSAAATVDSAEMAEPSATTSPPAAFTAHSTAAFRVRPCSSAVPQLMKPYLKGLAPVVPSAVPVASSLPAGVVLVSGALVVEGVLLEAQAARPRTMAQANRIASSFFIFILLFCFNFTSYDANHLIMVLASRLVEMPMITRNRIPLTSCWSSPP